MPSRKPHPVWMLCQLHLLRSMKEHDFLVHWLFFCAVSIYTCISADAESFSRVSQLYAPMKVAVLGFKNPYRKIVIPFNNIHAFCIGKLFYSISIRRECFFQSMLSGANGLLASVVMKYYAPSNL